MANWLRDERLDEGLHEDVEPQLTELDLDPSRPLIILSLIHI